VHDRVCPPKRMRFGFGSRCRLVSLIADGSSPQAAATACGASRASGYRLWRRYCEGGWEALRDRPPVPRRQQRRLAPAAAGTGTGRPLRARAPGELVHVDIKRLGRFWTVGKAILEDGVNRSRRACPRRSPDQREGGGAREDAATRVGLPLRLPDERAPRASTLPLPALVQPTPTAELARRQTADQPRRTGLWVPHLARLVPFVRR
jgi:Winged helix-turn helix